MAGAAPPLGVLLHAHIGSWLNAVEGFFATLTTRRLKRGVFVSVVDLQAAINRFVVEHNSEPKPFRWTADPDKIIQAVRRGHQVIDSIHYMVNDTKRKIAERTPTRQEMELPEHAFVFCCFTA